LLQPVVRNTAASKTDQTTGEFIKLSPFSLLIAEFGFHECSEVFRSPVGAREAGAIRKRGDSL
jgi:hypothetical protein